METPARERRSERGRGAAEDEPDARVQTPPGAGPPFPAAGHCRGVSKGAEKREKLGQRFLRLFRKGKAPGPTAAEAGEGLGGSGNPALGKCGGERVRKQEEPGAACLPRGAGAPLARHPSPLPPDAPKAPPACERKQNTNHLQRHRLLRRHRPVTSPPQPRPLPPWA